MRTSFNLNVRSPKCSRCRDGGVVITGRYWDTCDCEAGTRFGDAINKGREDIAAGRFHRLRDLTDPPTV